MATLIGSLTVVLTAVMALSSTAVAWNIPGHMLSGTIAYQILLQENPQTIDKVKAVWEKHPWYANQWQARLQNVAVLTVTYVVNASLIAARRMILAGYRLADLLTRLLGN
jgi:hypothetical protein